MDGNTLNHKIIPFENFRAEVLADYKLAQVSRQCSILARKEVLTGKSKFGIFGDGKELAQTIDPLLGISGFPFLCIADRTTPLARP